MIGKETKEEEAQPGEEEEKMRKKDKIQGDVE